MALRTYTPINNLTTWLVAPYTIGQTGITVAAATLFGTPSSGSPTICTVINGNETIFNNATYMIREVVGVSPGNNVMLGNFLDSSVDQNIPVNAIVQRRIVATDFTSLQGFINNISTSGAGADQNTTNLINAISGSGANTSNTLVAVNNSGILTYNTLTAIQNSGIATSTTINQINNSLNALSGSGTNTGAILTSVQNSGIPYTSHSNFFTLPQVIPILDPGSQVFNAKAFGAVGLARTFTDGSMTSGTTFLSSPSQAQFNSGDVGSFIQVNGVAISGANLYATISSLQSATGVVLSLSSVATLSGLTCKINSNDTTPLTNMLLAATNGGQMLITSGIYMINQTLNMRGGQKLSMEQNTHIIAAPTMFNKTMLLITHDANNARTVNDGAIGQNSYTLNSATANFTIADIGKNISISGAKVYNIQTFGSGSSSINGGFLSNLISIGTTATATTTIPHNFTTGGSVINVSGATQTNYNGNFAISAVADPNTFSYVMGATGVSPATGSVTIARVNQFMSRIASFISSSSVLLTEPASLSVSNAKLTIGGISDFIVEGGHLDGNYSNNPSGQLFGIRVMDAAYRGVIRNVHISDIPADVTGGTLGDCLYFGSNRNDVVPQDILVHGCTLERAARCVLTVVAGQRITISDNDLMDVALQSYNGPLFDMEANAGGDLSTCREIIIDANRFKNKVSGMSIAGTNGDTPVCKILVTNNTFEGFDDNGGPFNQGIAIGNGIAVFDSLYANNQISNYYTGTNVTSWNTVFTGNKYRNCRFGIQVSADNTIIDDCHFNNVWGEQTIKIQGNNTKIADCTFLNCGDTARVAANASAFVAVINIVDTWLFQMLSDNIIVDNRLANNAGAAIRLSSTAIDQSTYAFSNNYIRGIPTEYANDTPITTPGAGVNVKVFSTSKQDNPFLRNSGLIMGSTLGNLFTANASSFETSIGAIGSNIQGATTGLVTGGTVIRSPDYSLDGFYSAKITATSSGASAVTVAFWSTDNTHAASIVQGEFYTGVVFIRPGTAAAINTGIALQLRGTDVNNGTSTSMIANNLTIISAASGGWQKVSVTGRIQAPLVKSFLQLSWSPTNSGDMIYCDCVSLTRGTSQHWQQGGLGVNEFGPGWLTVRYAPGTDSPFFLGAFGNSPVKLNVIGGSGGVDIGDGIGNVTSHFSASGILSLKNTSLPIVTKTSAYNIVATDQTIIGNATGGSFTMNLPLANSVPGQTFTIMQLTSAGHSVTVSPSGGNSINSSGNAVVLSDNVSKNFMSDGSNFYTV